MVRKLLLIACYAVMCITGKAELIIDWSKTLNDYKNYVLSSSGKMTSSFDKTEKAIRFDVDFDKAKDFWVYPVFKFPANKTLENVSVIRFDIKAIQPKKNTKYKLSYVMFGGDNPYFAYPKPTEEWQTVEINVANEVKYPEQVKELKIGMNPTSSKVTYFLRNVQFIETNDSSKSLDTTTIISTKVAGNIFIISEPLRFYSSLKNTNLKWTLKRWNGEIINSDHWPNSGISVLELPALPTGYYFLELSSESLQFNSQFSFAVVSDPAKRQRNPETFFAMDSAQSWLARKNPNNNRYPKDGFEVVSEVAYRIGLEYVRDRLSWNEVEISPNNFRWIQYEDNANYLKQRNIAISGVFHNAPARTKGKLHKLPSDLVATYDFTKKISQHFKDKMLNWEFWNEQDIGFAPEGAWDYAAAMKAAYLGFKAGDADLPVALGGLAITPLKNYSQILMDNGVGDYIDIFNVHTYHSLKAFPSSIKNVKDFLKANNLENRPIWFTENGCKAEGAGQVQSYIEGFKSHSAEQELIVAEYIPKMLMYMQSLGVDRDFAFVLPPYSENGGNKDWGFMRLDYSAKPVLAAFSTINELLNTAKLQGSMDLGKDIQCFLYELPDGSQTIAYWSKSDLDTKDNRPNIDINNLGKRIANLEVNSGIYHGRDIMGIPFKINAENDSAILNIDRYPRYLTGLKGLKATEPFIYIAKYGAPKNVDYDREIVIRADLSDDFILAVNKDSVDLSTEQGEIIISVFNLSDKHKKGKLILTGGLFQGENPEFELSPFGKKELKFIFKPDFDRKNSKANLKAVGLFNGLKSSPMIIPVYNSKMILNSFKAQDMADMVDPANWTKNSSGKMNINYDPKEQAIKFDVNFEKGVDRWIYPDYKLQLPQDSFAGAKGVSFMIKSLTTKINLSYLMVTVKSNTEEAKVLYLPFPRSAETWGKRTVLFEGNDFDPADIITIKIGMNPDILDLTYWIKDIKLLFPSR